MLTDGAALPSGAAVRCDVCLIGAGPAGITIARELAGSGLRITILERGGLGGDGTPDLDVVSPDFPSPVDSMRFGVGGMAPLWNSELLDGTLAARYLPLDRIDFTARYWVPNSGWPITFDELQPYYARARARCGIAPFDAFAPGRTRGPGAVLATPAGSLVTRFDQLGPASVFTSDAETELRSATDVDVITDVAALEIIPSPDGTSTTTVARRPGGATFTTESRAVILAGGAIENARLLLESRSRHPAGLGNEHDNVGRFYMDHPRVSLGYGSLTGAVGPADLAAYEPHVRGANVVLGKVKLADDVLRRERLLNGNAQLFPHPLTIEQWEAVWAARRIRDSLRWRQGLRRVPGDALAGLRRSVSMVGPLYRMRVQGPGQPSATVNWTGSRPGSFRLVYQPEQAPNRGNRVTLGERRDADGRAVPVLSWRWSDIDLRSIRRARQLLADELRDSGLGQLAGPGPDRRPEGDMHGPPCTAHHHLGTTRMHTSPRHGVVDADCRVHGTTSVYVAGGSVFPTGGHANPTLTIVALAIRLADHLAGALTAA